ncbi:MAG: hypothetical protein RLZ51_2384 [Pseudomonadota bacterium]|jgi:hypothetical protein
MKPTPSDNTRGTGNRLASRLRQAAVESCLTLGTSAQRRELRKAQP